MKVDDDMLMALADGELDDKTAAALRAKIAADPDLQADYALFAQTAAALRDDPGLGPVPDRLIRQIRDTPLAGAAAAGGAAGVSARAWRPLALVAGLALAFVAGQNLAPPPAGFAAQDYAQLPTGQTRTLAGDGVVRALASYDTADGLCRHLRHQQAELSEDILLCQSGAAWRVRLALRSEEVQGDFIPASNPVAELIDTALDQLSAGEPLSPDAERQRLGALAD